LTARTRTLGFGLFHHRGLVVVITAVYGHLSPHALEVQILVPLDLVVLVGLERSLQRREALTDEPAGRALFPIQHIVKAQAQAPEALLREVTVLLWAIDPEQTAALIDEMAASAGFDPGHGSSLSGGYPRHSHNWADQQCDTT